MKTAISIPDKLFHELELRAQTLGLTRSALYVKVLSEHEKKMRELELTEQMNVALNNWQPNPEDQGFRQAATTRGFHGMTEDEAQVGVKPLAKPHKVSR
jgi:hypothetical protein